MKCTDFATKPPANSYLNSLAFRLTVIALFIVVVGVDLYEGQWIFAVFWLLFLLLQLVILTRFRAGTLVKWVLLAAVYLLLIIQILRYLSR